MASFLNFTRDKQVNKVVEVEVNQIIPNPHQPRTEFEDTDIRALAESIAQNGILQPISIRRNGDIYELIAGERRLRAAKMCGLRYVPCIIHEISERNSAILALVENIQRQDLSFFDEAAAIEKLILFFCEFCKYLTNFFTFFTLIHKFIHIIQCFMVIFNK